MRAAKLRPRGRPPRTSLAEIVEAALAVGLRDLTATAVAERLGISLPTLLGYVGTRDELAARAGDALFARLAVPADTDRDAEGFAVAAAGDLARLLQDHPGLGTVWSFTEGPGIIGYERRLRDGLVRRGLEPPAAVLVTDDLICFTVAYFVAQERDTVVIDPDASAPAIGPFAAAAARVDGVGEPAMFDWTVRAHLGGVIAAARDAPPWA